MSENLNDVVINLDSQRASIASVLQGSRIESLLLTILDLQEIILEKQGMPQVEVQAKVSELLTHYSGQGGVKRLKKLVDDVNTLT